MKDTITKDELIERLKDYAINNAFRNEWPEMVADYIMPEFKPEVGKVVMVCSLIGTSIGGHKEEWKPVIWEPHLHDLYADCRPLTPEEIGK